MSRGKYSPTVFALGDRTDVFIYNAKGQVPADYSPGEHYDEELHFPNYDSEGFDSYGYSAYDADGHYVGIGAGVDRNGITEFEYLSMSDEDFEQYL